MIITNLSGGLGGQMFQYAFGRFLAHKFKTELRLHFTDALFNTHREFELDKFNISGTVASQKELKTLRVIENRVVNRILYLIDERFSIQLNSNIYTQRFPLNFDSQYLTIPDNSYIQGYWSDERYFSQIKTIIKKEFTLKQKLDKKNLALLKNIQNCHSVSLHVRRGDYITNKMNIPQFIGLNYYKYAVKKIHNTIKNPYFFIFSDDLDWCKNNLINILGNYDLVNINTGSNSYKDMILMSKCQNNIIANSTFSWWASWLNNNINKIIITPFTRT